MLVLYAEREIGLQIAHMLGRAGLLLAKFSTVLIVVFGAFPVFPCRDLVVGDLHAGQPLLQRPQVLERQVDAAGPVLDLGQLRNHLAPFACVGEQLIRDVEVIQAELSAQQRVDELGLDVHLEIAALGQFVPQRMAQADQRIAVDEARVGPADAPRDQLLQGLVQGELAVVGDHVLVV